MTHITSLISSTEWVTAWRIMPYSLYLMKNQREWYHNNSPKKGLRSHMVNKGSNTVNIILLLWKQGKHKGWNSFSRYKIFESDILLWSSSSLSTACTAVLSASSLKHWIQMWSSAIISRHTQSVFVYISPMNCNSHHRTYCTLTWLRWHLRYGFNLFSYQLISSHLIAQPRTWRFEAWRRHVCDPTHSSQ